LLTSFTREAISAAGPAPLSLPPLPGEVEAAGPGWTGPEPGLESAGTRLADFLEHRQEGYGQGRNRLGEAGISRLSADLRAGSLSIRTLWQGVAARLGQGFDPDVQAYLNELLWREFAHHTLWERPELVSQPFRAAWAGFPWRQDPEGFAAWREGRTGIPLVDAAALIAAQAPDAIPGFDWYLDHVHPNIGGHQRIARALAEQVWRSGLSPDTRPWTVEQRRQAYARHLRQLGPRYFLDGRRRVVWLDSWARRQRLSAEALPRDAEGQARLGFRCLDLGDEAGAREALDKALQADQAALGLIRARARELESEGRAQAAASLLQNRANAGARPASRQGTRCTAQAEEKAVCPPIVCAAGLRGSKKDLHVRVGKFLAVSVDGAADIHSKCED